MGIVDSGVYVTRVVLRFLCWCFFFKQKTAYEMRISDWSSDVCSSDLPGGGRSPAGRPRPRTGRMRTPSTPGSRCPRSRGPPGRSARVAARLGQVLEQLLEVLDVLRCHQVQQRHAFEVLEGLVAEHLQVRAVGARSEEHTSELQSL